MIDWGSYLSLYEKFHMVIRPLQVSKDFQMETSLEEMTCVHAHMHMCVQGLN